MRQVASYALFLFTAIMVIIYVLYSSFIQQQAVDNELLIQEACKSYLDIITDKGAITGRDYQVFVNTLGGSGASFKITLTVDRLYAIPNGTGNFVNAYRPAYGFSSDLGIFDSATVAGRSADLYWKQSKFPDPNMDPTYLKKFDNVTLTIQQTSMMTYQRNMILQFSLMPSLREWDFARGVRNSGNAIVNSEAPPISYYIP